MSELARKYPRIMRDMTARERAEAIRNWWVDRGCIEHSDRLVEKIERQIKAAERVAREGTP